MSAASLAASSFSKEEPAVHRWWTGQLVGDPPRFVPESGGVLDYGSAYAAKSGSTMVQTDTRVLFSFSGWIEPTVAPACGRTLLLPRELGVQGSALTIAPSTEALAALRTGNAVQGSPAARGSQVEVRVRCSGLSGAVASGATGKVGVRTLATADGRAFTEVGYDVGEHQLYVDHSRCCASANAVIQRAPLRATDMPGGGELLELVVIVDGGMLETFASQRVAITSLVSPDERAPGGLEQRRTTFFSEVKGLECTTTSYKLQLKHARRAALKADDTAMEGPAAKAERINCSKARATPKRPNFVLFLQDVKNSETSRFALCPSR